MDIKKFKTPFLIMIVILAFLEIMFLLKLLFADSKGFEWGSVTDWISAICNIAMAFAAVYAAINAKDWFKSKIKEKALNNVTLFLSNCDIFSMEMRITYNTVRDLNNTAPDYEPENFHELVILERDRINEMRNKLSTLRNEFKSLAFLDVKPISEIVFDNYFKSNSKALIVLADSINFKPKDINERYHYNLNFGRQLSLTSNDLRQKHDSLKVNIKELFKFP